MHSIVIYKNKYKKKLTQKNIQNNCIVYLHYLASVFARLQFIKIFPMGNKI